MAARLFVPGLIFATGMPILNAVATSLFSVGAFGTTTAITYAFAGLVNPLIALEYVGGGIIGGIAGAILVVAVYMLSVNVTAIHL